MTQQTTPVNFVTGKSYKGDKAEILHNAAIGKEYTSGEWATMNQWNQVGRSVARGEKGVPIAYYRIVESNQGPVKEPCTVFLFNRCQLVRARQA
ncbi:MAG TPA: ArdC family protein [Flavipsychrobacter sp.]|nr:ArdC family protein [Flavipsychrobacter sp.]